MPYQGKYARRRGRSDKHDDTPKKTGVIGQFIDNHIRLIAASVTVLAIVMVFVLIEILISNNVIRFGKDEYVGEDMTVGFISALDDKTLPISWKDLDGYTYETISENKEDAGTYVLRRYAVEGGKLLVMVGGYIKGDAYTGNVQYATVSNIDNIDFSFSLIEDDGFLAYYEKHGNKKQ